MCAGTEFGRGRTSHGPNTVVGARFSVAGAQGEEHHCMALLRVVWQGFWHFERFEGQVEASVLELTTRVRVSIYAWHSTTARAAESQATLTVQSARNKRIPQLSVTPASTRKGAGAVAGMLKKFVLLPVLYLRKGNYIGAAAPGGVYWPGTRLNVTVWSTLDRTSSRLLLFRAGFVIFAN